MVLPSRQERKEIFFERMGPPAFFQHTMKNTVSIGNTLKPKKQPQIYFSHHCIKSWFSIVRKSMQNCSYND